MSDELMNELDAMTKALEDPVGDPIPEPEPDPQPDPEPSPEPQPDPEPSPDPEPDPTPDPEPEDPRDVQIKELTARLEKLEKPAPDPEPEPEPAPADEPIAEQDFLGELDLDELTRDPKAFNALLNKVYTSGMKDSRDHYSKVVKQAMEDVVKSMPDIVKNNIAVNAQATAAREKFFKENPDLEPWRTSVATVFSEVAAANADKKFDEIMKLTAEETRRRLNLKKEVKKEDPKPPNLPGVKKGERKTNQPDPSALEAEMDAMDKALGL